MAYDKANRPEGGRGRRGGGRRRKKVCVFCGKENYRKLCKAPEGAYSSDQESAPHRFNAVRSGLKNVSRGSLSGCFGLKALLLFMYTGYPMTFE